MSPEATVTSSPTSAIDVELVKLLPGVDVKSFEPCFEAAAKLGARHVLTQVNDPVFDRTVGTYAALCDLAAPYQLTCDIEFIPCGLMIDTLHFVRAGCHLEELL
ncbi:MAG: hypothetical protein WD793_06985 [Steroidobacteraceae bacterium]